MILKQLFYAYNLVLNFIICMVKFIYIHIYMYKYVHMGKMIISDFLGFLHDDVVVRAEGEMG